MEVLQSPSYTKNNLESSVPIQKLITPSWSNRHPKSELFFKNFRLFSCFKCSWHDPLDMVYTHYMHRFKESTFTNNCDGIHFLYNKHTMLTFDKKIKQRYHKLWGPNFCSSYIRTRVSFEVHLCSIREGEPDFCVGCLWSFSLLPEILFLLVETCQETMSLLQQAFHLPTCPVKTIEFQNTNHNRSRSTLIYASLNHQTQFL